MPDSKSAKSKLTEVQRVARRELGFAALRPGQEDAVQSVLDGHDTVVVQPTGSGKSAIYQAAGLLLDGATVIVSPLIALQKDQVDSISEQPHEAEAALINSTLPAAEMRETLARIASGSVEFIFLAPEQLRRQATLDCLKSIEVSLFVIDEAHCISEWGHDFRPDYLTLGNAVEELGRPTVLAMTATAAPEVRQEIIDRLSLREPRVLVRGFDRPNIELRVDTFQTEDDKLDALTRRVRFADKPGIVYVATRKNAESIMGILREEQIEALFYHGGLKAQEREEMQDRFMQGKGDVVVATNAFGMGIDKADVRFVYHFDIPDSIDSYYQEIGRAGRDGERAEAVLFYRQQNLALRKFQAGSGKIEPSQVKKVAEIIDREVGPVVPEELSKQTNLSARKVSTMINRLKEVGAIETAPDGDVVLTEGVSVEDAAVAASDAHGEIKQAQKDRVEAMQRYAELTTCRREYLLRYFGEDFAGPCSNCDNDVESKPGIVVDENVGTRKEIA